jgi:hypothetical protein
MRTFLFLAFASLIWLSPLAYADDVFEPVAHLGSVTTFASQLAPKAQLIQINTFRYLSTDPAQQCSSYGWVCVFADFESSKTYVFSLRLIPDASAHCSEQILLDNTHDHFPMGYASMSVNVFKDLKVDVLRVLQNIKSIKGSDAQFVGAMIYSPIDGTHFGTPVLSLGWRSLTGNGVLIYNMKTGALEYDGK